jgi:hypothetical protein
MGQVSPAGRNIVGLAATGSELDGFWLLELEISISKRSFP